MTEECVGNDGEEKKGGEGLKGATYTCCSSFSPVVLEMTSMSINTSFTSLFAGSAYGRNEMKE